MITVQQWTTTGPSLRVEEALELKSHKSAGRLVLNLHQTAQTIIPLMSQNVPIARHPSSTSTQTSVATVETFTPIALRLATMARSLLVEMESMPKLIIRLAWTPLLIARH